MNTDTTIFLLPELHEAIQKMDMLSIFLELRRVQGLDVDSSKFVVDAYGHTPLHFILMNARSMGDPANARSILTVVKTMLDMGMNPLAETSTWHAAVAVEDKPLRGVTPLEIAGRMRDQQYYDLIISYVLGETDAI